MKNETLVYVVGCIVVVGSAMLKILYLPFADYLSALEMFVFTGMFFSQAWYVVSSRKKIKELEEKSS